MSSTDEALLALTSITFIVAVGGALIHGLNFWRRYRIHVQVTDKAPSVHSIDLEAAEPSTDASLARPARLHSRHGSMQSTRGWPGYNERRGRSQVERKPVTMDYLPFSIPEDLDERTETPATVNHFAPP
ncbi:hypothetical protein NUU61_005446 [Penicillium alfredii]|uniref:Uncharacterized protein n=1 Tax=Penicillium alfredii TaxID=1506179 RepID=A0A9W9K7U6_9EURO|nr:uncharacterized protein NUU61_005446 [Penicillium alfredii]KAJ5096090.1 hypothetical protein NUU61_005446 [Penicillium alfredii]